MRKEDWQLGFKAMLPVCISYIPIGLACGVVLQQSGFNAIAVLLTSLLIFGGASQFLIASLTMSGAGFIQIITMVFFINLRHILMSSSLASKVKNESHGFNAIFAQTITDESFAINTMNFRSNPDWTPHKGLASGLIAYVTWGLSTLVGALLGNSITLPIDIMNYLLTAMFIYLLVSQIENKIYLWTAVFAGVLAVIFKLVFQNGMGVIISPILASFFGLFLETRKEQKEAVVHEP